MKATGIVRRIDDLGRVVIPKEIRRTLRIREGDPLEIFTDREGEIILKKYSPIGELAAFAGMYADSLAKEAGCLVCICDMDQVVAASGNGRKEVQEKYISKVLQGELEERNSILAKVDEKKYIHGDHGLAYAALAGHHAVDLTYAAAGAEGLLFKYVGFLALAAAFAAGAAIVGTFAHNRFSF